MASSAFRKSVLFLFSVYLLTPFLFIFFNFFSDPYHRYQLGISDQQLKFLSADQNTVLTVPGNYDDRLFLKKYLKHSHKPEVMIMGGSRSMNWGALALRKNLSFLNGSLSGVTLKDQLAVWQAVKKAGKTPQSLILCLDAQTFYGDNSENLPWLSLAGYYLQYESKFLSFKDSWKLKLKVLKDCLKFHFKNLCSWEVTLKSIEKFKKTEPRSALLPANSRPPETPARNSSLALIHPDSLSAILPEISSSAALQNGEGESYLWNDWNRFPDDQFNELSRLIEDMRKNGVQVVVVLMPYHPEAWAIIRSRETPYRHLMLFAEKIKSITESQNAFFYDAMSTPETEIHSADFFDGVHLKKESSRKLLAKVSETFKLNLL